MEIKNYNIENIYCKDCREYKNIIFFASHQLKRKTPRCISCYKQYRADHYQSNKSSIKEYYQKNKEKIKEYRENNKAKKQVYDSEYAKINKEKIKKNIKIYYEINKDELKEYNKNYFQNNKEYIYKCNKKYKEARFKTDPIFKLRHYVSKNISRALKSFKGSKNGESCLKYLSYSIDQLKEYLETQFEPWMNWKNHGKYNIKPWNDNDQSTWVWNIDHIIPQSYLPYKTMQDDNFKKCWALSNLRPLSAKQNVLDGNRR